MKIYLISYATHEFRLSQALLSLSALACGCDKLVLKNEKDLKSTEFFNLHQDILEQKRGAGYWLWKYYYIKTLIDKIEKDDIIVYADSGLMFRKSIQNIIEILIQNTKGVLLFHNNYENGEWTKRDCFVKLNCDSEEYYRSPLIFGGLQLFQKNDFSIGFINEVLKASCMENMLNDEPCICGLPNLAQFIEHRHDQSVTSLIAHKMNITLYPDPSQFRTKNVLYGFPYEVELKEQLYKNIVYVHRLKGLTLFLLPFKLFIELINKFRHK